MSADAVTGRCNILVVSEYETFDHQVPIDEFVKSLKNGQTPDQVCVLNLGEAFAKGEADVLSRAIQDRALDLNRATATIQFGVDGSIQSVRNGFELLYKGELYRLDSVFGADLEPYQDREDWLTATF